MTFIYRFVFDFVKSSFSDPRRDYEWEAFVRSSHAPFGIPRFSSREEALEAYSRIPKNARSKDIVDNYETLDQVIIPFLESDSDSILFDDLGTGTEGGGGGEEEVTEEFMDMVSSGSISKNIDKVSRKEIRKTIEYLYHGLRAGIVVRIVRGRVVCFCPFYNPDFTNTWPPSVPSGHETFRTGLPKEKWWANGGILCTEAYPWGTHFCMQIKDMIAEAAHKFQIPDAVFCINKRDYPQLKWNPRLNSLVEPYGFLFDRDDRDPYQDVPLAIDAPENPLPMLSFYGGERFLDFLIPPTEDWESSRKIIYLPSCVHKGNLMLTAIRDLTRAVPTSIESLETKKDVLFFRGSATGSGTSIVTNQRMLAFELAQRFSDPRIDIKCVSLGSRIHKHWAESTAVVGPVTFPVSESFYVPMSEQCNKKFLLYVEGHCAACRLGIMLGSGSVVFKVDSTTVADQLWYTHLLQEGKHFVRVRADLSNLKELVDYYIAHPAEAQTIALNARRFYETYVSNTIDYVGIVLAACATC